MKLKSIKVDKDTLSLLNFMPNESLGVGFKAMYNTINGDGDAAGLKDSDLAVYKLLMRCVEQSTIEHEAAVSRGKKSAQVRKNRKAV